MPTSLFSQRTALAVVAASVLLPTAPTQAGQVSWTVAPASREGAGAVAAGLRLYALGNDLRSGSIRQQGRRNIAGLVQRGRDNVGLVEQRGDDHSGTLTQTGEGNSYGLFQFGRGARDQIVQDGNGGSGATFSYGW